METDQMAASVSELQAVVKNIDRDISRLQTLIEAEDDKMLRYKVHLLCLRCSVKCHFFRHVCCRASAGSLLLNILASIIIISSISKKLHLCEEGA